MKFVAFDCETSGIGENDFITCIVAIKSDENKEQTVHKYFNEYGKPIDVHTITIFVELLWDLHVNQNYEIISYNGLSFDFKFLARHADNSKTVNTIETLALSGMDIMLDFATEHGYMVKLQSFAEGCRLAGKTNTGAWAAETWKAGDPTECEKVVEYCKEDVRVLCDLVYYRLERQRLHRKTKSGSRQLWVPQAQLFRCAHECITAFQRTPVVAKWMPNKFNMASLWDWIVNEETS